MSGISEALQAVESLLDNMDLVRKHTELNAVLMRTAYETLKSSGFTEEQAIELIKARGPMLA